MNLIGKTFAIIMLPFSILLLLKEIDLLSFEFPIDIVILGAVLMISLQVLTIMMLHIHNKRPTIMNVLTASIFILIALAAIVFVTTGYLPSEMPIIMSVTMFVEALYALH